jgi:protein SCO1/2
VRSKNELTSHGPTPLARRVRVARLLAPVAALLACAAVAGCGSSAPAKTASTATLAKASYAAPALLTPARQAPDFTLRDSTGKLVSLSQFRGKAVLLTFIYDHCPDVCPLIVANLHNALLKLGSRADKVQIVAVSVDPRGDTPATVKAFLAAHQMTGRMEYLIGSLKQLAPVWHKYGIAAEGSPDSREVTHTALVYGVTGSGTMLALYPSNFQPAWIVHDVPLLAAG